MGMVVEAVCGVEQYQFECRDTQRRTGKFSWSTKA